MLNHFKKSKVFTSLIEECAAPFGGIPQLAEAFEISTKAIYQWENNGMPEGRFFQLEILTAGKIKAMPLINKQNQLRARLVPPKKKYTRRTLRNP